MDMRGVSFTSSILAGTDFSRATLDDASFRDAWLLATSFEEASLRNANFSWTPDRPEPVNWYVARASQETKDMFTPPTFDCADLRGADLSAHPLFALVDDPVVIDGKEFDVDLEQSSFVGAILDGAKFVPMMYFRVTGDHSYSLTAPFQRIRSGGGSSIPFSLSNDENAKRLMSGFIVTEDDEVGRPSGTLDDSITEIGRSFLQSTWKNAVIPKYVRRWIEDQDSEGTPDCTPRAGKPLTKAP
jgi:hypothetical protein